MNTKPKSRRVDAESLRGKTYERFKTGCKICDKMTPAEKQARAKHLRKLLRDSKPKTETIYVNQYFICKGGGWHTQYGDRKFYYHRDDAIKARNESGGKWRTRKVELPTQ